MQLVDGLQVEKSKMRPALARGWLAIECPCNSAGWQQPGTRNTSRICAKILRLATRATGECSVASTVRYWKSRGLPGPGVACSISIAAGATNIIASISGPGIARRLQRFRCRAPRLVRAVAEVEMQI